MISKISGEKKVASMKEIMDFKKGIHLLEWEKNRSVMHMEDLQARARHIQMLKLTKDLQTVRSFRYFIFSSALCSSLMKKIIMGSKQS